MDQNQWFNTGSPAPMNDRQAFEAGWTAAQRQMAYTPQINERIFQQTPRQLADCCCENRQSIAQVRYDMATDACAIKTAINEMGQQIMQNDNANYRALDVLPESTVVRQITTANAFDSISLQDLISVNCCDFDRITVTNTGALPVVISTNPLFYVKRIS